MRILDDNEISDKTANFLINKGIKNIEDLSNVSSEDVMSWDKLGRRTLEEILQLMKKYNVSFSSN